MTAMASERTDKRMLDAALELFSRDGYKATTTKAIASAASVNEVTLFRHFGSKEKLLLAVIDRETDLRNELERSAFSPSEDMVRDLTEIGLRIQRHMRKRSRFVKLVMVEVAHQPRIWDHASGAPLGVITFLGEYFREAKRRGLLGDVDVELAAASYFSFFFGSMISNAFLGRDIFCRMDRHAVERHAYMFVHGVSKGGSSKCRR